MKFLLLNQFYPPDTAATGQLLEDVAHALSRAGHEVHVVCSRGAYGGGIVPAPRVTCQEAGLWVHRVSAVSEGRNRFLGRLSDWGSYYAAALAQSICLARCDACLALTTPPFIGIVVVLLKALKGTRLVLWTMDIWPEVAVALGAIPANGHVAAALRSFAKWTYDASSRIISLGPVMTERLCALGVARAKITNAHNWVPGEVVTPQPWSPGTCAGQP